MEQKLFIKEDAEVLGQKYSGGYVYQVDAKAREELLGKDKAEVVDFVSLDSIELALERAVNDYKTAKERLKASERYKDAESIREDELKQLREKLETDVAKLKQDYELELASLEKQVAQEALNVDFKPDENVNAFMDMQLTKLSYTGNMALDLDLLAVKIGAMDDNAKLTVLSKFGQLKNAVDSYKGQNKEQVESTLKDIYATISKANTGEQFDRKLMQIKALKGYSSGIDMPYRAVKMVEEGKHKEGGAI